jgi:hypothetical protein
MATRKFKVVGQCTVAGVAPGDTVTEDVLNEWGANIDALLGAHLEEEGGSKSGTTAKAKEEGGK